MQKISDEYFQSLIDQAMSDLPQEYIQNLDNVAITYADAPTPEQLEKQHVGKNQVLLGLYEGIPQTARYASGYSGVLPDKITLFKQPLLQQSANETELYQQIKRTIWHEIAHHYGLDHHHIDALQQKKPAKS